MRDKQNQDHQIFGNIQLCCHMCDSGQWWRKEVSVSTFMYLFILYYVNVMYIICFVEFYFHVNLSIK